MIFTTYKSGKEARVAQVGSHLTTFGDGTSNDGGSSGSEGKLEEPTDVFRSGREVTDEEVGGTDEALAAGVVGTVCKGVTDGVETEGTTARIQQVLQHDVLDVLLTDGSGTEHGETGLHHKDEGTGKEKEEDVKTFTYFSNSSRGTADLTEDTTQGGIGGRRWRCQCLHRRLRYRQAWT